jgi:FtsP/CotA-like multicopper oxidase with cupredoxin domain
MKMMIQRPQRSFDSTALKFVSILKTNGPSFGILCLMLCLAIPVFSQCPEDRPEFPDDLKNPPNVCYDGEDGKKVEITASKQAVTWAGHPNVKTNVYSLKYKDKSYDASYTPPTIRVNPGTTLNINLTADLDYAGATDCDDEHHQYTNLHYHGFEVSPNPPQDDVITIKLKNKDTYPYAVVLPQGHPEGMFWYHPHPHGCSFFQVNGGMSGVLIVGDILKRQYPKLAGIRERILLLKDGDPRPGNALRYERRVVKFSSTLKDDEGKLITVNGMDKPKMFIHPGEKQFFRIGNVGTNAFVKIAIKPLKDAPKINAEIIAVDGMATDKEIDLPSEGWLLPPGSRVEMIVEGPKAGIYEIISTKIEAESAIKNPLATLEVREGPAKTADLPPLQALEQVPKARSAYYPTNEEFAGATGQCTIHPKSKIEGCTFVFSVGGGEYRINDKAYDENVTDVTCKIGPDKVYEWTLCNDTGERHAFHIHQIHFDVLDINGKSIEAPVRDVVDMPPRIKKGEVSKTRIRLAFKHDYLEGKFVFHCHMLTHEDKGMMMNIVVEK